MNDIDATVLGPLVGEVLPRVATLPAVREGFYFTGGTALSGFFLRHRVSLDLDFATDFCPGVHDRVIVAAAREISAMARGAGFEVEERRAAGGSFAQVFLGRGEERMKVDLASESPYKLDEPWLFEPLGLRVYSLRDMAANKLGAMVGRLEARDFVDVYFLRERMARDAMLRDAREKDPGLDPYPVAVAMREAANVAASDLPTMLVPFDLDEMKRWFDEWAAELVRGLLA